MKKQALLIVRPLNILILCLTQFSLWFKLGAEIKFESKETFDFLILCLSASLIAAAGYIVNDIHDYEIDMHNKPGKVYVGNYFTKKSAWIWYFAINSTATGLSLFLPYKFIVINIISIILLFFYSYYIKQATVWGNLIIALLSATAVFEICWFVNSKNLQINNVFLFFIFFSFLTSLLREIIKDLEDMHGDLVFKRKTLAIRLGIQKTKILLCVINFVMMVALCGVLYYISATLPFRSKIYLLLILIFPVIFFMFISIAKEKSSFSRLSFLIKLYMLIGIVWLWTF